MLDKKQIWMIFFFKFKLGRKTVETIRNINNAFSPGTANECTVQWCFKKFCKRDKSLETRSMEACHRKLTMTSWAGHQSWSSYSYRRSCPRNSMPTILWSFCIWKQIGKVKKHSKWVLHTSTADQKSLHLASLVLCNHSEPFLSQTVMCDEKWNLCHNWWWPAQWLDWEFPKHFPKPNWHRKSSMVTVWWPAAGLTHYSFLNPSETITSGKNAQQISEMRHKLQRLQVVLLNRKEQILFHDNTQLHVS